MLYLINQKSSELEIAFGFTIPLQEDIHDTIKKAIEMQEQEEGYLSSALDPMTAQIAGQLFGLEIPSIQDFGEYVGATPDDVAITIPDNMELGDEVIAIVYEGSYEGTHVMSFTSYTKWE